MSFRPFVRMLYWIEILYTVNVVAIKIPQFMEKHSLENHICDFKVDFSNFHVYTSSLINHIRGKRE